MRSNFATHLVVNLLHGRYASTMYVSVINFKKICGIKHLLCLNIMQTIKSYFNIFFSCDNNDEWFLPTLLVYSIVNQFQNKANAPTRTVHVSSTQPSSKYVLFTYLRLIRKCTFPNTFDLDKHMKWLICYCMKSLYY